MRAQKQKFKKRKESLTQLTVVQKSVLAKKLQPANVENQKKILFVLEITKVKLPSKAIETFREDVKFLGNSHFILGSVFTAKYNKSGKRSRKRFRITY